MNTIDISHLAYRLYVQDWVDTHTTPEERLQALKDYYAYINDELKSNHEFEIPSFAAWLEDFGYAGMRYVCYEEFCDAKYHNKDYILRLLGDDEELIQLYYQDLETDKELDVAVCKYCGQKIDTTESCICVPVVINSIAYEPLPVGNDCGCYEKSKSCPDCGAEEGFYHHPGCGVEACPNCGFQLISCCCNATRPKLEPGIDAVFKPGKIHGCEDELYIIYFNECANDGNGRMEIEIVDYKTILEVYEDADHDANRFFKIMPDYFHGRWQYADAPSDDYLSLVAAYETADFICGRDGNMDHEMKFIVDWATKCKEKNTR